MANLLMVSLYYAPDETGIAPYSARVAEHFAMRGHRVTVLTGLPHYPAWRRAPGYERTVSCRERRNGVNVIRRWHSVPARPYAFARMLSEGSFLLSGLSALAVGRPDAVIGVMPSVSGGVIARLASHRFGAPYGVVMQDLSGPGVEQSGTAGADRLSSFVRHTEAFAVRRAAAVGIVAEGFRPYLDALGVDGHRMLRVRNWSHAEPPSLDRCGAREALALPHGAIICLHAGNMGLKQGLENVIEAASLAARDDPRLLFVLLGDGSRRTMIEALAERYLLPNVRFLPVLPSGDFANALAAADVLLLNQQATVTDMALPSKLTSYFAAERPVIAAVARASEAAREVVASGGGIVVPPEDPPALLEGIRLMANDAQQAARLGANGARFARRMLTPAAALRGYEHLLETILGGPDASAKPVPATFRSYTSAGRRMRPPPSTAEEPHDEERLAA